MTIPAAFMVVKSFGQGHAIAKMKMAVKSISWQATDGTRIQHARGILRVLRCIFRTRTLLSRTSLGISFLMFTPISPGRYFAYHLDLHPVSSRDIIE